MEIIIKIKDKKMYDSFVQFFKSLGLQIETGGQEKRVSKKSAENFINKWGGVIKSSEIKEDSKLNYLLKKHK